MKTPRERKGGKGLKNMRVAEGPVTCFVVFHNQASSIKVVALALT
jgi:hypothetical protein